MKTHKGENVLKKKFLILSTLAASLSFSSIAYADAVEIYGIVLSDTPEEALSMTNPGVIDIGAVTETEQNEENESSDLFVVNQIPHQNASPIEPQLLLSYSDPRDISTMPKDEINSLGVQEPLHPSTILSYKDGPEEEKKDANGNVIKPIKVETIVSGSSGPDKRDETNVTPGSGTSYNSNGPGSENYSNSELRNAVISYAKQFVGNPYVYGGTSLTEGADCSGFVMKIFEHFGINTGRDSRSQAANCQKVDLDSIKPGDLLFYASGNTINHVAIYIGNDQIVHAEGSDSGITISYAFYRTPYMAGTFI